MKTKRSKLPTFQSHVYHPAHLLIKDPIAYMRKTFKKNGKTYTTFLRGLLHRKLRGLDSLAAGLHKQAFRKIDCLDCANCCKTMSPTYTKTDINRIAKHLGLSFQQYFDKYLEIDDEGAYLNRSLPCQFLQKDNKCGIYSIRPKDCSGFPHTQLKDFKLFISGTHIQNIEYCPITLNIVERMHEIIISKGKRNLTEKDAVV